MSVDPNHFDLVDGQLIVQPWMQLRRVTYGYAAGVSKRYPVDDGKARDEQLHTLRASWTNDTPVNQLVYGMVTRGGVQVTLQARTRAYLALWHGYTVDDASTDSEDVDVALTEVSKVGCGLDTGSGGLLGLGAAYAINEYRQNSQTMPLMPHVPEWFLLEPGQRLTAQVDVKFTSVFWENTSIDGGDAQTESMVISGDTQLDLFALPAGDVTPRTRATPSVVSESHHISAQLDDTMLVDVPPNTAAGDVLVAFVCSQTGNGLAIGAPAGWLLTASNNLSVSGGAHMAVFTKIAAADEEGSYTFAKDPVVEQMVQIIAIRDASPVRSEWDWASRLVAPSLWDIISAQKVPSIDADGELLIAASYLSHASWENGMTQFPPAGLTPFPVVAGNVSLLNAGYLLQPDRPTPELTFTASQIPTFSGHTITAALLIRGQLA